SFDHTDKLGPELLDIAREKAGIIKSHKSQVTSHKPVVISAPQEKVVIDVIRKRCKQTGARLYEENKDFFYEKTGDGFKIKGIFNEYPELKISLLGKYQLINAALAVGIIEALHSCNIKVNINSIRRGLYSVVWPGRMQVIEKSPFFIVDGAQNRASAKALKESLKDFSFDSLILLLGISANKDIAGITQELCPQARQVILTKANNPRAAQPEIFEKIVKKYCRNTKLTGSTEEGLITARQAASKDDLILATGSFYLVGEILKTQIHLRGVFGFCEGI
ncbi:MAG: cyanophycin synthetase, partial [Candidatus Omnitrophota bacterium]|nr:cyanophycin synthetase [Candidatus Omnitrophota bacterium]